jgi:hypothetical protein
MSSCIWLCLGMLLFGETLIFLICVGDPFFGIKETITIMALTFMIFLSICVTALCFCKAGGVDVP